MSLDALLACPRCDASLRFDDEQYHCKPCRTAFPLLAGIPFLFSEPEYALGEWRARLNRALAELERDEQRAARALEASGLAELTRRRLELMRNAWREQRRLLAELTEPLEPANTAAAVETYLALRTRLPSDQGLNTYYQNIHRDWCWGDEENAASAEQVGDALPDTPGKLLVLGSGASRLAYDLHQTMQPELTVALDFNPLLLILARRICAGESLELYEFPLAPRTLDDHAVRRTLAAPAKAREGLHFVLADALRPPFAAGVFDTVLTPWLTDILPEDFGLIAARINGLLREGGRWVNFGSMAFEAPNAAEAYSSDEALALVTAHGFTTPRVSEAAIPYMCSPASRHGRRENVITFFADKDRKIKSPRRYQSLPDWLVKGEQPVPLNDSFQMQAMSTRVHAFVMSLIDGRRSIKDMAELMHEQKLMPRDEAEPTIRNFLIKIYEQ